MADPFIGDYRFSGPERTAYNRLTNRDEQWAYLVFARERHAAEDERKANNPRIKHKYRRDRFLVMREWRALDPEEHKNRIKAARTDLNRPDAIDVAVPPGVGSPGSINDFSDIGDSNEDNNDGQWTNGFNYRFARSLWHRGYRQENAPGGYWSAVRLYVGVDDSNKVRDASLPASDSTYCSG
ncbi:hypothetical protein P171DRAFT_121325 [Karstenula rhodostoma CBS 690.94]|uniref:Uncharacterized protein n=1 Tax=Karstenula rhodostoma CBS 690.94 TaxID=1392251 RepID=A0A9P4U7U3_9PLEO|nr:hypothetical protein P171DRAFT_121325 [Karstenula rhodostoma CBS 690.94]